jgi:hypothetical protein
VKALFPLSREAANSKVVHEKFSVREGPHVTRIDDFQEALRRAEEALKRAHFTDLAQKAGAALTLLGDSACCIRFIFFTESVEIQIGESITITIEGQGKEVSLEEKIILCHYLLNTTGASPTGQWITFRQIPDGHFYDAAFQRRTRDPFLLSFGRNPQLYRDCAEKLGGSPAQNGDVGMTFRALPHVPVQLVLWQGDEELPPESTMLFDATISQYLPAEDIAVLSGMLVYRLIRLAKTLKY